MNEYTGIADYYDLLMTSGYYNYEQIANAIKTLISRNQKIIEIGVGTGLVLAKLSELIDSQCSLAGMDHTPEMLDIAKKRLGDRVNLFKADILSMSIAEKFDVAISNGGLCAFVDKGSSCDYYTHLIDNESNLQALQNISNCLNNGGLFIINVQGVHDNYDKHLPGGIIYSQEIVESTTQQDCIEKTFYFKKDDRILAQQRLIYRIFQGEMIEKLFNQAGFKLEGKDKSGQLIIYSKK
ncbi:class I SAM-dependent methyltransferase [Okeania sp. SIO2B3]|uniref:class I SAM-dependent DNA methyltransferase n=1 Tax=Okeania sp. SIO2B3 TaxID=2607784 RepID=UPI0013C0AD42|nr:class I SAM-dependent methyltransferase [Okeania sp. SIO2B3]NET42375.1 class I SAM-dependent methyltransferase [Okeania sp. SIO2B3]